jgi:hypothetical protein
MTDQVRTGEPLWVAQVDFCMKLSAVTTHLAPMEASSVAEIPQGAGWQYEPKWDGFRCLAFRRDDEVDLRSKAGQPRPLFPGASRGAASGAVVPLRDRRRNCRTGGGHPLIR